MGRPEALVATTLLMNVLASLFVAIRIISRFFIVNSVRIDDYLIIFSLVLSWAVTALVILQVHYGLGQHLDQISAQTYQNQQFYLYIYLPIYNSALSIVKLSALTQFLRFFVMPKPRLAAKILIGIVLSYGIAVVITLLCFCIPVPSFWIATLPGNCIDYAVFWYFNSTFNLTTDVAVVILPMYVLKDLTLPQRQKWAVWGVFMIGGFACIFSFLRLYTVHLILLNDDSYDLLLPIMWASFEINVGMICACMPCLKPLIEKLRIKCLLDSQAESAATGSSNSLSKLSFVKRPRQSVIGTDEDPIAQNTTPV